MDGLKFTLMSQEGHIVGATLTSTVSFFITTLAVTRRSHRSHSSSFYYYLLL